ncbi:MAG: hypothetical protein IIA14_08990 [SAR324 cluster bacterium]|nr:hypothetical protein [SAR324 cluster bacterium]
MENLKRHAEENLRRLAENPYPGRGIVLGRSHGGRLLQFYWVMGRSESSRNRVLVREGREVRTQALDPAKVEDPSLVIYTCMREARGHHLVSNGDHTDTLAEAVAAGKSLHDALASIVRLHLDRVVKRMADGHDIALVYDDSVVNYIVGRCLVQETGARVLIGFIEQHVLPRLSALWLDAFASRAPLTHIAIGMTDASAPPARALTFEATPSHLVEPCR